MGGGGLAFLPPSPFFTMIFRSNKAIRDGLISAQAGSGKFKFVHVQNVDNVAQEASDIRHSVNAGGWSDDKEWKWVGHIPVITMLNHPEWNNDREAMLKWLNTEFGSRYKISNP
jgi:hypothetical protein